MRAIRLVREILHMFVRASLAAFAAAALFSTAALAQTESVSFSIENNSSSTIESIQYGQSSDDTWSDNILDYQVEPGMSVDVVVDDGLEGCMYDFMYNFDDGESYAERVDMCELDGSTHEFTGG